MRLSSEDDRTHTTLKTVSLQLLADLEDDLKKTEAAGSNLFRSLITVLPLSSAVIEYKFVSEQLDEAGNLVERIDGINLVKKHRCVRMVNVRLIVKIQEDV
jgi:hypothetical protein